MLTPSFSCTQDETFVIVAIVLSTICKVMEAAFDIQDNQFTFHCHPYYLRLRFNQLLEEGRGERATYDLESNTLSVYLPKAVPGETFTELDNNGYLIATEKQRRVLLQLVGATPDTADAALGEEAEEAEEEEFVQQLPEDRRDLRAPAAEGEGYGFARSFHGVFARLDADMVGEVVRLPDPEGSTAAARRALRLQEENADFDEEAVLVSFEDEDGAVAELLRYVPAHMQDLRRALESQGVLYATAAPAAAHTSDAYEEEGTPLLGGGAPTPMEVWRGNIADFKRPLITELPSEEGAVRVPPPVAAPSAAAAPTRPTRLAIPRQCPTVTFTKEEHFVLERLQCPRLLFPPAPAEVLALTVDMLLAEAYDDLFTQGCGCCESVWTLCALSPALSYLDPADTIYDAARFFARRVLLYPLHRHYALVQRAWAMVGARLLLGRSYVVRALLRVREVLAHSEHRMALATVFLDPLIAYWMNVGDSAGLLLQGALELHEHVARTAPVTVEVAQKGKALLVQPQRQVLQPLTLEHLGLPLDMS
ncbi:protein SHQ1 [Strigomonas culicis]|uniref:Protein SHQ1 n=1 Tax=Strigomonas culicis TaxID=28005 RepID=S9TZU8_9TRYP|nr:protein SHQ1 [Strigomonas culicis]EPY25766.1 protein SHQ1 [Strigomonas culicis]|eukprot:EPY22173.1 protein SHQ1 [Strigomonas culicis]